MHQAIATMIERYDVTDEARAFVGFKQSGFGKDMGADQVAHP